MSEPVIPSLDDEMRGWRKQAWISEARSIDLEAQVAEQAATIERLRKQLEEMYEIEIDRPGDCIMLRKIGAALSQQELK